MSDIGNIAVDKPDILGAINKELELKVGPQTGVTEDSLAPTTVASWECPLVEIKDSILETVQDDNFLKGLCLGLGLGAAGGHLAATYGLKEKLMSINWAFQGAQFDFFKADEEYEEFHGPATGHLFDFDRPDMKYAKTCGPATGHLFDFDIPNSIDIGENSDEWMERGYGLGKTPQVILRVRVPTELQTAYLSHKKEVKKEVLDIIQKHNDTDEGKSARKTKTKIEKTTHKN